MMMSEILEVHRRRGNGRGGGNGNGNGNGRPRGGRGRGRGGNSRGRSRSRRPPARGRGRPTRRARGRGTRRPMRARRSRVGGRRSVSELVKIFEPINHDRITLYKISEDGYHLLDIPNDVLVYEIFWYIHVYHVINELIYVCKDFCHLGLASLRNRNWGDVNEDTRGVTIVERLMSLWKPGKDMMMRLISLKTFHVSSYPSIFEKYCSQVHREAKYLEILIQLMECMKNGNLKLSEIMDLEKVFKHSIIPHVVNDNFVMRPVVYQIMKMLLGIKELKLSFRFDDIDDDYIRHTFSWTTTPIRLFLKFAKPEDIEFLEELYERIDVKSTNKRLPMHLVVKDCCFEVIKFLLSFGKDKQPKINDDPDTIINACTHQSVECVRFLIHKGITITMDRFLKILETGNNEVIKLIVSEYPQRVDIFQSRNFSESLIRICEKPGNLELLKILYPLVEEREGLIFQGIVAPHDIPPPEEEEEEEEDDDDDDNGCYGNDDDNDDDDDDVAVPPPPPIDNSDDDDEYSYNFNTEEIEGEEEEDDDEEKENEVVKIITKIIREEILANIETIIQEEEEEEIPKPPDLGELSDEVNVDSVGRAAILEDIRNNEITRKLKMKEEENEKNGKIEIEKIKIEDEDEESKFKRLDEEWMETRKNYLRLRYTIVFQVCCQFGDLEMVKFLLEKDPNFEKFDPSGKALLFRHAIPEVGFLYRTNNFRTIPLAVVENLDIAKLLLSIPIVDPTMQDCACFRYSCSRGNLEVAKYYYNDGRIDPGIMNNSALKLAMRNMMGYVVLWLLSRSREDKRIDPSVENSYVLSLLYTWGRDDVIKVMIAEDERLDVSANDNRLIRLGLKDGNIELIQAILKTKSFRDENGLAPFLIPISRKKTGNFQKCVKVILDDKRVKIQERDAKMIRRWLGS